MTVMKRTLLILLTLTLLLSMAPAAYAAGESVTEGETYVLQRAEGTNTDLNLQYASPYTSEYVYDGLESRIQSLIYSMHNTAKNGEIIPTYCMDIKVDAKEGTSYRRLNLEDATYASSVAGRIRAIVLNGFYVKPSDYATSDEHTAAVHNEVAKLAAAAGVDGLTLGEAISATQCAIWQVSHGSRLSFPNFVRTSVNKTMSGVQYKDLCKEELTMPLEYYPYYEVIGTLSSDQALDISNRIRTVYNYLLSLPPVSASSRTVSPSSFTDLNDPVVTFNGDGTCNISVTATVSVDMSSGDSLTLTATLKDGSVKSAALHDGKQTVTLSFDNMPAELQAQDVMLSISGYQTASGVFLFDANGDRSASQTMVGMDSSRLPVYAQVVAQEERVLNITKTTSSGAALEGIIFDVYKEMSLEDYLNGADLQDPYVRSDLAQYTLITGSKGQASLNLTQQGLDDGIYLVVERKHPAIVSPIDPFYITLPMTNAQGTGYDYVVNTYPKNQVSTGISIDKDVTSLGQDSDTVDAYENHTWILSANIPGDFDLAKSYVISDTLDYRLDYLGNLTVTLETEDGQTVAATLEESIDYTLHVEDVDSLAEGTPSDSFTLSLTKSGMAAVVTALGTNSHSDYRIRVTFDARINANAEMGTEIPNQATVAYVNSVNITVRDASDVPVVFTGGINLLKVDSENENLPLPGAVFEVYRTATQEEIASQVEGLKTLPGLPGSFVKVSFFDKPTLSGGNVNSVTSGEDGKIAIYGLAYDDYYLVETQAPAGYNLLGEPTRLTVNESSHLPENTVLVENTSGTVLPETGGPGISLFLFWGLTLMSVSILLILRKKNRAAS